MKILVIGLGSMGKRRIRLIQKNYPDISIYGCDTSRERCDKAKEIFGIKTTTDLDSIIKLGFQAAFICTSPLTHSDLINICLINDIHVFSEINLVVKGYDENINLSKEKDLILFLSSTFLYRDEILEIDKVVKSNSQNILYNYHVGQYLPDWHPWESYSDYFVSNKETNACREILAIELPWLTSVFGKIKDLHVFKQNISSLKINYPDSYTIILKHENGNIGSFLVDIVSRKAVRKLTVINEKFTILWEGTPKSLIISNDENNENKPFVNSNYENIKDYNKYIVENAYENEIINFFNIIKSENFTLKYSFENDKNTLSTIDMIEGYFNEKK
jgi:predicted dehydrogenase